MDHPQSQPPSISPSSGNMTAIQDIAKNAINRAILELFRIGMVHSLVSEDAEEVIGTITKDGKLVSPQGITLAILKADGKLVDPTGVDFMV